jgi:OPT family oligopeptide transporter
LKSFYCIGILRRFLIWPSNIVWPGALPTVALIRVLHEDDTKDDPPCYPLSRLKFFLIATGTQFIYSWLPEYIMPVLQRFSFLCMIVPNNRLLAQLTSANGFSMAALQLDWKLLTAYLSSPIIVPRWAQVNILAGFVLIVWIAGPLVFYLNLWDAGNLPIRSTDILTPNGSLYLYMEVDDHEYRLNESAYLEYNEKYGPIRLSAMRIINLACHFLFIPALLVHTCLYHGKWIWKQIHNSSVNRNNDIHCKLMSRYTETPEWWFILLFIVNLVLLSLACHFCHLLPGYFVLMTSIIGSLMVLPFGLLIAQTAQTRLIGPIFAYNLLGAVLLPSNPAGFDTFIRLIFRIQAQALEFLLYLKISHFMKLPPRVVFFAVISSVILSSIVAYTTSHSILSYVKDICQPTISIDWKCSFPALIYSKTVFWTIIRELYLLRK